MHQLGYEKMVICGDDWSGGIALVFASLYPKRIELCVSIDSVCYSIWPAPGIEAIDRAHFIGRDEEFLVAESCRSFGP